MAINFDALPQSNPFGTPNPGLYLAKIEEARMKQGKDTKKPPYLNVKYSLTKHNGESGGTLYDIISESDSQVVQYKLGRFLRACNIPLQGTMELKDIAKLVQNKTIVVDVALDDKAERPRAQVDLFSNEAYYQAGEFEEIYRLLHPSEYMSDVAAVPDTVTSEEVPFIDEPVEDSPEY
jgi:hypothetical protein